jgi:ATP-binding cassette subfamily B multidrug efflux pump
MARFFMLSKGDYSMKEFLALRSFVAKYKWMYLFGLVSIILTDVLQIFIPKIIGFFTDDLKRGDIPLPQVLTYLGSLLALAVGMFVFRYLWRMQIFGAARKLEYDLRNELFAHYQSLSTSFYNNVKTGDLMAHATNDLAAIRFALAGGVVMFVDTVVLITFTLFMMIQTISLKLTLIGLMPLPALAIVAYLIGKVIHRRFRKSQESFSLLTDRVQENISGMRVVKAFVQEDAEVDKFSGTNNTNYTRNMRVAQMHALFHPLVQMISGVSLVLVLGYGGILVIRQEITLGDFVAFNFYLGLLTWPMLAMGWMINIFQRGAASMGRINDIFANKGEIVDDPNRTGAAISMIQGDIRISNLTFTYPGASVPALQNIDIHVPIGSSLAVVGRTGSGKSTLANLLVRLYNVEHNRIQIDGRSIEDIPLKVLRNDIGYVPQDNFLFSATIEENVGFGLDQYDHEQVVQAARDAQLHENVIDFPKQYDTMLGERGVTLSGGQKQRLSIARALIKNPSILILDDSLSAVDTATEEAILEQLKRLMVDRTTILISHRISTIEHADQIIVMDEGQIVEQGNHSTLLAQKGLYFEMYEKQLLEEKIANQA